MATLAEAVQPVSWRREPAREQWLAYLASRLGWTLDAFGTVPGAVSFILATVLGPATTGNELVCDLVVA